MRTSIELVPRSRADLLAAAALVNARYPRIDTVNVPDVASCELDSVTAVTLLAGSIAHRIPHLRSRDFSPRNVATLASALERSRVDEVIVIAGDVRGAEASGSFTPVELIGWLTRHFPRLTCYAALDSHRFRDAKALATNIATKRAAGAAGFFTQPLFSIADVARVAPATADATVFWGLSPVVSPASRRYWERVNRVEFPADFEPTLKWNQQFALHFLSDVAARGDNAYLMPIKVDLTSYLEPLQARFG